MSISISLIVVNFNGELYLAEAIASVLSQTRRDFELLIWDDGSSDRSVEIARSYARQDSRIRVIAAQHQGIAQARKDAIANTKGKYLGWVDSDDWLAPTALAETGDILDNNLTTGMVYTDYYDVDSQGTVKEKGKRCNIPYSPQRLLVDFMTFHFRLIRREVYDRIGGIDPNYQFVYDYDLCLRLSEVTTVQRVQKPLYYYRYHQQSRSAKYHQARIDWSQQAISNALKRRGLADEWQIQVTGDRFSLEPKQIAIGETTSLCEIAFPSSLSNLLKKTKTLLAVLPFTLALGLAPAQAQQIVPNNDGTMTVITEDGNSFNIDGGTLSKDGKNLFHSFQEFGLDAGQIANFLSNPNIQNILGRINGGNPSIINGLIQVTGGNSNLFLMNPSGIVFGNNATLNVPGDFAATTATGIGIGDGFFNALGSNDYLNLVGNPNSFNFEGTEAGTIINAGNLEISAEHSLSLTGGKVINTGTIEAPGGNITVAAIPGSNKVRISQEGQILSLEVAVPTNEFGEQLPVKVTDLPALLRGLPVEVDTDLEVAANDDVTVADSETTIPNTDGTTIVSGELDASGNTGGEINVLGDKVGLINGEINASGNTGGGEVLVGGDYKGEGSLPTADVTFIDRDSLINADALETGDGGRIIAWSDASTRVEGKISATGGEASGDGGFVETSSAGFLDVKNNPDVSATNGQGGTWLIDPPNITIVSEPDEDVTNGIDTQTNPFTAIDDDAVLEVELIQQALQNGSDVTVSTGTTGTQEDGGNITLEADLDFNGTGNSTLTFKAANNIFLGEGGEGGPGDIFDSVPDPSDALNLIVTANSDDEGFGHVQINKPINTGGGDLEVTGVGNFADGIIIDTDFDTAINSEGGNITLNGIATTGGGYGGINIQDNLDSSGGNITLNGTGPNGGMNIQGDIDSDGGNVTLNGTGSNGTGVIVDSNINAGGGDINVTGTSDGNDGVFIRGQVTTSGTGAINVTGTSTQENGIETLDTQVSTVDGEINLSGTSTNSIGINTQNTEITSTNGAIAINGTSTNNDPALIDNTDISTGNNLTFTLDDIDLSDTTTLTANTVTLQPQTPESNIAIAPTEDVDGSFNISQTELNSIADGTNIIIGRNDGTGTLTIANDVFFIDPVTLNATNIAVNGLLEGRGDASITINGAGTTTTLNSDITTQGQAIAINDNVTLNTGVNLNTSAEGFDGANITINGTVNNNPDLPANPLTLTAGTGDINITGAIGNENPIGGMTANSSSLTNFGSTVNINNAFLDNSGSLTTDAGGTTRINGNITTDARQTYNDAVELGENVELVGNGYGITFNSTVRSPGEPSSLTITTNEESENINSDITFNGAVGDNNQPLLSLETNSNLGETVINGGLVTTTGDQTYNNVLTLGADTTLNGTNITFDNTVGTAEEVVAGLTVNAGTNVNINNNITTDGGEIAITSGDTVSATGNLDSSTEVPSRNGGNITVNAENNITLAALDSSSENNGGNIDIASSNGAIDIVSPEGIFSSATNGNGGNVTLRAAQDINLVGIVSGSAEGNGGNITLESTAGQINATKLIPSDDEDEDNTNNLGILISGARQNGGNISLTAPGDITTGYIYSGSFDKGGNSTGGDISLKSEEGSIDTKAGINNELIDGLIDTIDTTDNSNQNQANSEPTNIAERVFSELSDDATDTEQFKSTDDNNGEVIFELTLKDTLFSGISSFSIGDAGAINLTTISPTENILTGNINAQSSGFKDANDNIVGRNGGEINISTKRFFQADDTFTSIIGLSNVSISNLGRGRNNTGEDGEGNGRIRITHGGNGETPFIVGDASVNGTAGTIISTGSAISPDSFLFTERRGNIDLVSIDGPSKDNDDPGNFLTKQPEQLQTNSSTDVSAEQALPIASIPQAQETLRDIAQAASQKPALVYVGFAASQLDTREKTAGDYFTNAENCRTAEYEDALALDKTNANPTLCILPKPSDRLELLVITDEGDPIYVPVDITREEVEKTAQRLYREVSRPGGRYYKAPAKKMYEWLIGSIEKQLEERKIDNLLFVMPPKLRSLPIAALYDAKTDLFLAQKDYNVGFAPSLNLMNTTYANIQKSPVLAFGASNFEEDENQQALPAVEIELPTIKKIRGGRSILNENFTFENLKQNLNNQRPSIVHLSTHADFDTQNVDNIYIQLYDRKLSLGELESLELNKPIVDLLVISACRSAFGDREAELGFGGLAVKAGVKTAIGSLWYVGDTSTSALMSEFYHQLKTAPIKAEALKEAQVAMIEGRVTSLSDEIVTTWANIPLPENLASEENEDTDWSHPYYWAPFTIIGSPW